MRRANSAASSGNAFCILGERCVPRRFALGALLARVPGRVNLGGNFERRMSPTDVHARGRDLLVAQRRAVRVVVPALLGEPLPMMVLQQIRLGSVGLPRAPRWRLRWLRVVAVDVRHHLPAVGLETLRRVVGEPAVDVAVDRDAVVVVEGDQLAQPQRAGQRTRPRAKCLPSGNRRPGTHRCSDRRYRDRAG